MSSLLAHKSIRIKKGTHGHALPKEGGEIRADYELIDRLQQYKHITKSLLSYYEGLAAIQHTTAKATHALETQIQVPFHEGHQFMGDGGWQEALYSVRDETKRLGDLHETFATTIEKTVVNELQGVRAELKAHITAIEKEAGAIADEVDKERATSASHLTQLQSGIDTYESSDSPMLPQHDPYLSHSLVHAQLKKQVLRENDLQAAIIRFQQQQPGFEESIVKNIQSAVKLYDEAKHTQDEQFAKVQANITNLLTKVSPTAEYEYYKSREGTTLLDPNAPTRSVEAIQFPGLDHASTKALKEGHLERKKRFTKSYNESYYILTPSGYLHERKTSDPTDTQKPGFSLFLPECTLGPPSKEGDKSHKFHVEGNKAVKSSFESKVKNTLRFGGKEIAYTFRARTHGEMMAWWNEMDQLSKATKTSTDRTNKSTLTPISAAVANVGYADKPVSTDPIHPSEANTVPTSTTPGSVQGTNEQVAVSSTVRSSEPTDQVVSHEHIPAGEEDDEESGGSSAEEEDEEQRQIRTAPSTPAVHHTETTNPLESSGEEAKAETLPTYAGNTNNVPVAEKNGKGPILGEPLPVNSEDSQPTASTSNNA